MTRPHVAAPAATTPAAVVRTYLLLSGLFTLAASVIWGVNTLFLLDAGLDIFQVFIVNAAFTAGMVLFEVPTGVVADSAGRRRSFLLSAFTLMLGTLGYLVAAAVDGGVVPFVFASLLLGLGYTFYSGAVEAWLVDALAATGYEAPLDRVFARGSMVSGVAMIVGSIGGGLLGAINLSWPFVVRAGLLAIVFVVAACVHARCRVHGARHDRRRPAGRGARVLADQRHVRMAESARSVVDGGLVRPWRVHDVGLLRLAAVRTRAPR